MVWALAVDLGTTACSGAVRSGDRLDVLEIGNARTVPSSVMLVKGDLVAGQRARQLAPRDPASVVHDPKRKVGGAPFVLGDGTVVPVHDALAALLGLFVREGVRRFDGDPPSVLALTHPAAWNETQLTVLRTAADKCLPGVTLELIPEPVAAAVYYAGEGYVGAGSALAIYDLGGGTFDTAVLRVTGSGFDVLGRPGGDPAIGGNAFDQLVFEHFGTQLRTGAPEIWDSISTGTSARDLMAAADLLKNARDAKEALTEWDDAQELVYGGGAEVTISREQFHAMIDDDVDRTVEILRETIATAGLSDAELSGIFVTGGSSRTPLVRERLAAAFGAELLRTRDDPKLVVALGAARSAALPTPPRPREPAEAKAAPGRPAKTGKPAPQPIRTEPTAPVSARAIQVKNVGRVGPARTFKGHNGRVLDVAFAPDGRRLASASGDRSVRLVGPANGATYSTLTGNHGPVRAVRFSPGGNRIATASDNSTVRLWEVGAATPAATLRGHTGPVNAVVWSPDGDHLASGADDDTIRLWNPATGKEAGVLTGHTGRIAQLEFAPDGRRLASASADGTVRIWDTATRKELSVLTGHTGPVHTVAFSPDGLHLATGGKDGTVRIWASGYGRLISTVNRRAGEARDVAYAPDGTLLAVAYGDNTVRILATETSEEHAVLRGHTSDVTGVAFSPDGEQLASSSFDMTVKVWTVDGREPSGTTTTPASGPSTSATRSPTTSAAKNPTTTPSTTPKPHTATAAAPAQFPWRSFLRVLATVAGGLFALWLALGLAVSAFDENAFLGLLVLAAEAFVGWKLVRFLMRN